MSQPVIENLVKQLGIMRYNSIGNLNNPYYTVTDHHLNLILQTIVKSCMDICEENGAVNSAAHIKNRFSP